MTGTPPGRPDRGWARARRSPRRDQNESAFASILRELVARLPGARAAALVDFEGETVDYAGILDPFAIRVAGAQLRVIFDEIVASCPSLGGLRFLAIRAGAAGYLVHELPERYALVVRFSRGVAPFRWHRPVAACAWSLAGEAGWRGRDARPAWLPVEVLADGRHRPAAIRMGARLLPVEVLGRLATSAGGGAGANASGSGRPERGWRVRLESGIEATLVCEPGGLWYSDEPPADV